MAGRAEAAGRPRGRPPWVNYLIGQGAALLGAFAVAGVVGSVIVIAYGENPLLVYETVWAFSTSRPQDFAVVLENATPLIFSGRGGGVALKAGFLNIGGGGQYFAGRRAGAPAATGFDSLAAV